MSRIVQLELRIRPMGERYSIVAFLESRTPRPPDPQGSFDWETLKNFYGYLPNEFRAGIFTLGPAPFPPVAGDERPQGWIDQATGLLRASIPRKVLELVAELIKDAGETPSTLYRLNVHSELSEVLDFPWQLLLRIVAEDLLPGGTRHPGLSRVAVMVRYPEKSGPTVPFRLPLILSVDGGSESQILDAFGQEALQVGALKLQDARTFEQESAILHLIDRSHSVERVPTAPWPRLLVLQRSLDPLPIVARPLRLISDSLVRGIGAVLQVAGPPEECRRFFQHFYRKVLSNQPLEECVREALALLPMVGVDAALGVRERGEYGLLLTDAVREMRAQTSRSVPMDIFESERWRPFEPAAPAFVPPPRSWETNPVSRLAEPRQQRPSAELKLHRLVRDFQQAFFAPLLESYRWIDAWIGASDRIESTDEPIVFSDAVRAVQELQTSVERVHDQKLHVEDVNGLSSYLRSRHPYLLQASFTRLLQGWLSQDTLGSTWLHVKLSPIRTVPRPGASSLKYAKALAENPPELLLELAFGERKEIRLDVCVFHDSQAVQLDSPRGELLLPRRGESTEFRTRVRLHGPGQLRLRVCIFYEGALLQSLLVEAEAATTGGIAPFSPPEAPPIRYVIDYVASPDFVLLDQRPRPSLSLVTNHSSSGDLWLGVFSSQDEGRGGLRAGTLHSFSGDQLSTHVSQVRGAFEALQGQPVYLYKEALDGSNLAERARRLVQLAIHGARLFNGLFNGNRMLPREDLRALHRGLEQPGLISIARCNLAEQSIPWAMLYDRPLDTGDEKRVALCPIFTKQLEAREDRLDDPSSCRALPECPLRGPEARYTVCPFGFWGVHHQIEQPVKQLLVEDLNALPRELVSPAFVESCQLLADTEPPQAFMGCGSHVPALEEHYQELCHLPGWSLRKSARRGEVLAALEEQPHLLYLYCHGVQMDGVFKLQFPEAPIEASSLNLHWDRDRPPFFVFLNACDSLATLPETINHFLGTLIHLGALAVIGSEIRINSLFARRFARRVLEDFLAGRKLGEAFLAARRHFLRELNPLGLAYTLHAAADVHLHGSTCSHCKPSWRS